MHHFSHMVPRRRKYRIGNKVTEHLQRFLAHSQPHQRFNIPDFIWCIGSPLLPLEKGSQTRKVADETRTKSILRYRFFDSQVDGDRRGSGIVVRQLHAARDIADPRPPYHLPEGSAHRVHEIPPKFLEFLRLRQPSEAPAETDRFADPAYGPEIVPIAVTGRIIAFVAVGGGKYPEIGRQVWLVAVFPFHAQPPQLLYEPDRSHYVLHRRRTDRIRTAERDQSADQVDILALTVEFVTFTLVQVRIETCRPTTLENYEGHPTVAAHHAGIGPCILHHRRTDPRPQKSFRCHGPIPDPGMVVIPWTRLDPGTILVEKDIGQVAP